MSEQNRNLEWRFFDTAGAGAAEADGQGWERIQSPTGAAPAPDSSWTSPRHPGRKCGLRDLLVAALFIIALLWLGPWHRSDKTGRQAQASTTQPASLSSHSGSAHPLQRDGGTALEQIADRLALAEYQASLTPGVAYAEAQRVPTPGMKRFEQIADHQALAEYHATLTGTYIEREDTE